MSFRRLARTIQDIWILGAGFQGKIALLSLYVFLLLKSRLFGKFFFRTPKNRQLIFREKKFDFYVKNILDFHVLREMFIEEQYRLPMGVYPKTILDLGSNVGASILYFKLLFPEARIYGFEPNPACWNLLQLNTKQFEKDIQIFPYAVSSSTQKRFLYFNQEHWSASFVDRERQNHEGVEVPCINLDEWLNEFHIPRIDLLKFDIEGAEYEIFHQFSSMSKVRYLMGEIHPSLAKKSLDDFFALVPSCVPLEVRPAHGHVLIFCENSPLRTI